MHKEKLAKRLDSVGPIKGESFQSKADLVNDHSDQFRKQFQLDGTK